MKVYSFPRLPATFISETVFASLLFAAGCAGNGNSETRDSGPGALIDSAIDDAGPIVDAARLDAANPGTPTVNAAYGAPNSMGHCADGSVAYKPFDVRSTCAPLAGKPCNQGVICPPISTPDDCRPDGGICPTCLQADGMTNGLCLIPCSSGCPPPMECEFGTYCVWPSSG